MGRHRKQAETDPFICQQAFGAYHRDVEAWGEKPGFVCIVVTNQSAVGRGMMTEADLARIHDEFARLLQEEGASLDAIYHCPHHVDHPERKPAPGMLLRAAEELDLDLPSSWMVGDSLRAVHLANRLLDRGINVLPIVHPAVPERAARLRFFLTSEHEPEHIRTGIEMVADEMDKLAKAGFGIKMVASLARTLR